MEILYRGAGHLVERVSVGLWRIVFHLPTSTNCWLYKEQDGLTLVDAGCPWNGSTIINTIGKIDLPLKRIVITHAHPDHAGGAAQIAKETGATVFAHDLEKSTLEGRTSIADAPASAIPGCLHRAAKRMNILQPPVVNNVESLVEGDSVGSLKVIHAPGHTPGSITLYAAKEQAMFIGDNASNRFNNLCINWSYFTLNFRELRQSIYRYSAYPTKMLLPGHGGVHRSNDAIYDLLETAKSPSLFTLIR